MTTGDAGKGIWVPELPEHWNPLFLGSDLRKIRLSMSDKEWAFLAACVNAVYSPGGLKQQLSDLQQRVRDLEEKLSKSS